MRLAVLFFTLAVFLTLLSSAAYATLTILLAARVFERETVMLGGREQIRGIFDFSSSRGGVPSASWSLAAQTAFQSPTSDQRKAAGTTTAASVLSMKAWSKEIA